jgi:hypothetical protein
MYCTIRFSALSAILILALSGCQSHQSKVDALQKEYDQAEAQFRKDCNAEYLKVPPTLSPKCSDEDKKAKEAWNRVQAERAKD